VTVHLKPPATDRATAQDRKDRGRTGVHALTAPQQKESNKEKGTAGIVRHSITPACCVLASIYTSLPSFCALSSTSTMFARASVVVLALAACAGT